MGIYSFITKVANVAYLAASPFLWIMFPYIVKASKNSDECIKLLEKQLKMTCVFIVFALGFFLINVENLVKIVAHDSYLNNLHDYYLVSFYPILLLFVYVLYQQLMIVERKYIILISYLTGLVFNTVFSYLLIENYKVTGAIISTLIGLFVTLIIMLLTYKDKQNKAMILKSFLSYVSVVVVILIAVPLIEDVFILNSIFALSMLYIAIKNNVYFDVKEMFTRRKGA